MWIVSAFHEGSWSEIPFAVASGEPFSARAAWEVARKDPTTFGEPLTQYLLQQIEVTALKNSHAAVETWAREAVEEASQFSLPEGVDIQTDGTALYHHANSSAHRPAQPATIAWHDRTTIVIKLPSRCELVKLAYHPDLRDEDRVERMRNQHPGQAYALETIFDWRGYFGPNTAIVDKWSRMRATGAGFVTTIRARAGYIVGSVLRRLSVPRPTLQRDPTARRRLIAMAERYPAVAQACHELESAPRTDVNAAMVFVHGTLSCGLQGLKDLLQSPNGGFIPSPFPIFRFEHDTFRPIAENAAELARLVHERTRARNLVIAAHSRGGLVGRLALNQLRRDNYDGQLRLMTFGTPHAGTPLVSTADNVLNVFWKMGGDFVGALPAPDPFTLALSVLSDAAALPQGLADMAENTTSMDILQLFNDRSYIASFGSRFDYLMPGRSGFGVGFEGMLAGLFGDIASDLVVPTASCFAAGENEPLLNCSHVQYFAEPAVRNALLQLQPRPDLFRPVPGPPKAQA